MPFLMPSALLQIYRMFSIPSGVGNILLTYTGTGSAECLQLPCKILIIAGYPRVIDYPFFHINHPNAYISQLCLKH